ncbi:MAG: hypothetical protein ACREBA_05170 [Nitrosotalea sp.]
MRYNLIVLVIRKLLWNERNTTHVARHDIIPEEVEEICRQEPVVQRGTKKNRLVLLGPTSGERFLKAVLENHGAGTYYVVTAYEASIEDKKLYNRLKD